MKLRKDWKLRLRRNYKWLARVVIAMIVLSPAFLTELLLVVLSDLARFVSELADSAKWKWQDSKRVIAIVERVSTWVGKSNG